MISLRKFFEFLSKFWQVFFSWKMRPSEADKLKNADVIIGQSFGIDPNNKPGISNEFLANIVTQYDRYDAVLHHYPYTILQWEIADCVGFSDYIISESRIQSIYLDTYEVLAQTWVVCQKEGWKKAIIVAHPDHVWRVAKTAEKLGFQVLIADTAGCPYNPQSTQPWTRNRPAFIGREILARLLYLYKGWL